jgi:hypothetical protein
LNQSIANATNSREPSPGQLSRNLGWWKRASCTDKAE